MKRERERHIKTSWRNVGQRLLEEKGQKLVNLSADVVQSIRMLLPTILQPLVQISTLHSINADHTFSGLCTTFNHLTLNCEKAKSKASIGKKQLVNEKAPFRRQK